MGADFSLHNWRNVINEAQSEVVTDDIALLENPVIPSNLKFPFRIEATSVAICLKGSAEGTINLKPTKVCAPCLIVMLTDSIVQFDEVSEDFSILVIIMSSDFLQSLKIEERVPVFMSLREAPVINLTEDELQAMFHYFDTVKRILSYKDNPYKINIIKHYTMALFYGLGYGLHLVQGSNVLKNKYDVLFDNFIRLVEENYKKERSLDFYANELCMSSKHLSKVIKEKSGKSPVVWIKEYVIHDAKSLLKSTDKTIQQISDELNFPSQSFFGKYFKRIVGVSPVAYRDG